MTRRAPYRVEWDTRARDDLRHLAVLFDPRLPAVGLQVVADVVNHHKHGKALGERHVSGNLRGFYRLNFDVPQQWPLRYRFVYSQPEPDLIRVDAFGQREGSEVYQMLAQRLGLTYTPPNVRCSNPVLFHALGVELAGVLSAGTPPTVDGPTS